jgi:radical SAM family uncharacterized protein/radical SAM-linked protein
VIRAGVPNCGSKMSYKTEILKILKNVEKPGRYLGGEWNSIIKDPSRVRVKVALAFPDLYEVGMSYLGQKILYYILNGQPSILAERVFAPGEDFEIELRRRGVPLFSLENRIPLDRFDIIGFSLLYELNYSNVLNMLDLGRIPLYAKDRDLDFPLVIAGGPAAFNPEPIAHYFDLFLIGDGEEAFLEVIEKYFELTSELNDKTSLLKEMAKITGVYVPILYIPYRPQESSLLAVKPADSEPSQVKKRTLFPFHKAQFPDDIVVPHIKVIFDRVAHEVARGCPQKCRFCQATSIYFPPRVKSPSSVISGVLRSLRSTGYEDASLTALSISDYPYLDEVVRSLMKELERQKVSLSLSSIRPKGLSPGVAQNIVKVRKTGFTLVPEAGSERLRAVINKKLIDNEIREAAENAFSEGWTLLKLYFMIGLPTEGEEDLAGMVHLVKEIINRGRKILNRSPQIHLSISSFIPKPHTPFQWLRMEEKDVLKAKYRYVLSRLKKYPFVRFKKNSLESSILEAVFSRGDRELNGVLHRAWKLGARFDSWSDVFRFQTWEEAFERENVDQRKYLLDLDRKDILPWDHIDTGINKSHLLEELHLALRGQSSPTCAERKCADCQGCSLSKFYQKKFFERVPEAVADTPSLGERTEIDHRYRASYIKTDTARFLSHIDVHTIIQQGFRRARISVSFTKGFHPKMQMVYPPALPLGMEGKREWIEFKSSSIFSENEFISQVNTFLPQGIRFTGIKKINDSQAALTEQIKVMVYSLDLRQEEVMKATEDLCPWKEAENNYFVAVKTLMDGFMKNLRPSSIIKASVDKKKAKLLLYMKPDFQKDLKPQQIIGRIFHMNNPVFFMAREEILFHD